MTLYSLKYNYTGLRYLKLQVTFIAHLKEYKKISPASKILRLQFSIGGDNWSQWLAYG